MARKTGSHAEITGPKVLQAAERLFARHGYAAVSMRQIAAEVGVQAGTLYQYTRDKQSLLADLMHQHLTGLLAALPRRQGTAAEQVAAFVGFHIRYHLARRDAVFIAYMELRSLTEENFAAIEALRRSYELHLETILRDGIASGAFSARDARLTTRALIAMLTGVTTWYREDGPLAPEVLVAHYVELARDSLGRPAQP